MRFTDKEELQFSELIAEGTYNKVEFKVFSAESPRGLEIWVDGKRHLITSEGVIEAVLQSIIDPDPTLGGQVDMLIGHISNLLKRR